ncbi:MAG: VTT domain-containing protein [Dehalococcoidia bacterium]|nr:VTT domain-containing protein [Dehalococcoidia bacterium]
MGFDLVELLRDAAQHYGFVLHFVIFGVVFAESGLFFGFFLPGDSLLFASGLLASQQFLNLPFLLIGCFVGAVGGDSVGYWFGNHYGRRLFDRRDSVVFRRKNLVLAERYYERHGGKTIVLARFIPAVRTFAPIVAGVAAMRYRTFLLWNVLGGLLWSVGVTVAGFFFGSLIPDVDKYLLPVIALIVAISVAPAVWEIGNEHTTGLVARLRHWGRR